MLQTGIQKSFQTTDSALVSLPLSVSINELRNVVGFLRNKPEGLSLVEITDIFRRRLFDSFKLAAYETWGIIKNKNNLICLTPQGWKLAAYLDKEADLYREILRNFLPYHKSLEWVWELNTELVTYSEITEFWKQKKLAQFPTNNEKVCENSVVSFFNLCHAAELGISAIGRKGQPTRLLTNRGELRKYFNNSDDTAFENLQNQKSVLPKSTVEKQNNFDSNNQKRLLISCEKDSPLFPSLRDFLEIADIQYEMVIRSMDEMLPSDKTQELMRNCSSAIIIANEKSQVLCSGNYRLNDRLLSEIVATYTLFNSKVLLLWQGSFLPNLNFKGLNTICLKSAKLDWETGIKIGRIIKQF